MSSSHSFGPSSSGTRLGADGERVSERLGLHRQLLSKLAQSQALTGQDIESGYAPIWVDGRMVGVVCHEHVGGPRRWQFDEELLAGTMADFVAWVIEASDRLRAERTLGQYRDHVDELTRVEQALRRSGENLRIVLGAAPVALVLTRLRDQLRSVARWPARYSPWPPRNPSKLDAIQRVLVEQALASAKGNKSAAARLLGVHRKMLERMVKADASSDATNDDAD